MANTFKALCDVADWTETASHENKEANGIEISGNSNKQIVPDVFSQKQQVKSEKMNLHYNIQIHLPETTNMAVYDAIFQSLKKHLL